MGNKCEPDYLGFCYTAKDSMQSLSLLAENVYYIVSSEIATGDALIEMTDPATGGSMKHRDGKTFMSYRTTPMVQWRPQVTGRVSINDVNGNWTIIDEVDTSYGPINM